MGFHQFSVALVVMIMIILSKPNCGRAAVLVKSNTSYECNSLLSGCRIGKELVTELEFFMGSDVIRILGASSAPVTPGTNDPTKPVASKCPDSYSACLGPGGRSGRRGVYDRTPVDP